jgi:hypothetical protein
MLLKVFACPLIEVTRIGAARAAVIASLQFVLRRGHRGVQRVQRFRLKVHSESVAAAAAAAAPVPDRTPGPPGPAPEHGPGPQLSLDSCR